MDRRKKEKQKPRQAEGYIDAKRKGKISKKKDTTKNIRRIQSCTKPLQPENPSRARDSTAENTAHKLKRHYNQPNPPQHTDKRPFKDDEACTPHPAKSTAPLANTSVEGITQRLDCKCTGSIELNAQILGVVGRSSNAGSKRVVDESLQVFQLGAKR
jgi:hypothetical protein